MAKPQQIMLAHGGGGQLTDDLVGQLILPRLGNVLLDELLDSAIIDSGREKLALTIDSYVVQPLMFPGGDIGRLAVCGTVNDLAVCGARPLGLALGLILCEGLEAGVIEDVMDSMATAAGEAGVSIVTGDTKVVGRGQADGMFISTAGLGVVPKDRRLHPDQVRAGDALIINGPIADHGMAVMLVREMPQVSSALRSDVAPLNRMIERVLDTVKVKFMRDPTRGGLAGLTVDLARRTGLHIVLDERAIPVRPETRHAADMLGLDVLEVANEGKVVMLVAREDVDATLAALKEDERGQGAVVIGRVEVERDGICELRTAMGGRRVLQKPYGEQLPRIC